MKHMDQITKNDRVDSEPMSLTGRTWLAENGDNVNSKSMSIGKQVVRAPGNPFIKNLGTRKANGLEIGH